ncbi:MAG TPA: tetratricopeptide repeat protein [Steroidobacteraceae bacterium]|nr:tetratricopeptide repeat protein [Steroidobacteraceae bacterium]
MSDQYLTDDEQIEALKGWLATNGPGMLIAVALGAAVVFGYRFYESHANGRALAAAQLFDQMTNSLAKHDRVGAEHIAGDLTEHFAGSPYTDQAELTLARLAIDDGRLAAAETELRHVADSTKDSDLAAIAKVRLARVLIAEGKPDQALATLAGAHPAQFSALYDEARGDALVAKKDRGGAIAAYQQALKASDPRGGDSPLLTLKIADLGAVPALPGVAAAAR